MSRYPTHRPGCHISHDGPCPAPPASAPAATAEAETAIGCDPFENGYDPANVERLYRDRIRELMAERDAQATELAALWAERGAVMRALDVSFDEEDGSYTVLGKLAAGSCATLPEAAVAAATVPSAAWYRRNATELAALRARMEELLTLLQRVTMLDDAARRSAFGSTDTGLPDALRADLRAALAPRQPGATPERTP